MSKSTTESRLARAALDYDRATSALVYFSPYMNSDASQARKRDGTIPVIGQVGVRMSAPTHDEDSGTSMRGGSTVDQWDERAQRAYAAGRTLERCIQEHRFGRVEEHKQRHKWYMASGAEVRVTKDYAAVYGHTFPKSTPWLP